MTETQSESVQISVAAQAPPPRVLDMPAAVLRRASAHHESLVTAYLKQRSNAYRAWTWSKLALRMMMILGPHFVHGVPKGAGSLLTLAACIWIIVDLFIMPFPRAAHRAGLSMAMHTAVLKFLNERSKAHAPLEGERLHAALLADVRTSMEAK